VARNVTEAMIQVAPSAGIAPAGRVVAGKTGTVQHPTLNGQNKDAWMVGYTPSVSTAVWVGTDQSDPIKTAAGRPVFGRMLPGSIWQAFMNGAPRGEQFSPFVPLGIPLGVGSENSDGSDDEDSDKKSDDDEDNDDGDSDRSSSDSDRGSDGSRDSDSSSGSGDSRRGDSDSSSDSSGSDDGSSDTGIAFDDPRLGVPGLRSSNAGQQPLAAGAG
jgi:membrane peptidoglycan carboxypeptidase